MTDDEAVALLRERRSLGITLFDAADTYGNGRSEEQLARAFARPPRQGRVRDEVRIRFYTHAGERKGQQEIAAGLLAEVRPLRTRAVARAPRDRLHRHLPDPQRAARARRDDELVALLEDFKREGKIRTYGVALGPAIGWLYEGVEAAQRATSPTSR